MATSSKSRKARAKQKKKILMASARGKQSENGELQAGPEEARPDWRRLPGPSITPKEHMKIVAKMKLSRTGDWEGRHGSKYLQPQGEDLQSMGRIEREEFEFSFDFSLRADSLALQLVNARAKTTPSQEKLDIVERLDFELSEMERIQEIPELDREYPAVLTKWYQQATKNEKITWAKGYRVAGAPRIEIEIEAKSSSDINPEETPEPPANPKSVVVTDNQWVDAARNEGKQVHNNFPDLNFVEIAKKVHSYMVKRNITGRSGRVPKASTIKRRALTGIKK